MTAWLALSRRRESQARLSPGLVPRPAATECSLLLPAATSLPARFRRFHLCVELWTVEDADTTPR